MAARRPAAMHVRLSLCVAILAAARHPAHGGALRDAAGVLEGGWPSGGGLLFATLLEYIYGPACASPSTSSRRSDRPPKHSVCTHGTSARVRPSSLPRLHSTDGVSEAAFHHRILRHPHFCWATLQASESRSLRRDTERARRERREPKRIRVAIGM